MNKAMKAAEDDIVLTEAFFRVGNLHRLACPATTSVPTCAAWSSATCDTRRVASH